MDIKFTNYYGNKKNLQSKPIDIKGECVITNYSKEIAPNNASHLTVGVFEESYEVKKGAKNILPKGSSVDFNESKYNIFTVLAGMDGNSGNLTIFDLKNAKKDETKLRKAGVTDISYNLEAGIINISIGTGASKETLRIDFTTDTEKAARQPKASPKNVTPPSPTTSPKVNDEKPKASPENVTPPSPTTSPKVNDEKPKVSPENVTSPSPAISPKVNTEQPKTDNSNNKIQKVGNLQLSGDGLKAANSGLISLDEVKDIKGVARFTGLSEEYIKNILVDIEDCSLSAYNDNVGKGTLTIGFGHTNLVGTAAFNGETKISKEDAYKLLAIDINSCVNLLKNKLGNKYSEAPRSIRDSVVDAYYNKGYNGLNNSLITNLTNKSYGAVACRTWYETQNKGLQARNTARYIHAISSLNKEQKKASIKKFRAEHFDKLLEVFKSNPNLKQQWNKVCNECFNQNERSLYVFP